MTECAYRLFVLSNPGEDQHIMIYEFTTLPKARDEGLRLLETNAGIQGMKRIGYDATWEFDVRISWLKEYVDDAMRQRTPMRVAEVQDE